MPSARLWLSFLLTGVGCSIPIGVVLWITFTHDLHYNVYADGDEVWYQEHFPTYVNIIVTVLVGLLLGFTAAAVIWLTRNWRR